MKPGSKIERSLSANSGFSQIGTVAAGVTTYTSISLASSTTYYFRVAATNSAGSSVYSNTANATTAVDTASSAPVISLISNTSGDITLECVYAGWTGIVSTGDGYILEQLPPPLVVLQVYTTQAIQMIIKHQSTILFRL